MEAAPELIQSLKVAINAPCSIDRRLISVGRSQRRWRTPARHRCLRIALERATFLVVGGALLLVSLPAPAALGSHTRAPIGFALAGAAVETGAWDGCGRPGLLFGGGVVSICTIRLSEPTLSQIMLLLALEVGESSPQRIQSRSSPKLPPDTNDVFISQLAGVPLSLWCLTLLIYSCQPVRMRQAPLSL